MRNFLILLAFVFGCHALTDEEALTQWQKYQMEFGKSYRSPVEYRKRLGIFKTNLEKIEQHNILYQKGHVTYEQGVTKFTDWTPEEFKKYVNKYKMPESHGKLQRTYENLENFKDLPIPASVDWIAKGAVREVKDQGDCGSCWSFSATGAMEGAAFLKKGLNVSLSEQNLIDCAIAKELHEFGCDGGNMIGAFFYAETNGIASEESYPYEEKQGECKDIAPVFKTGGFKFVPATESMLKTFVAIIGPISVSIDATEDLQNYKSGVYTDKNCSSTELNHGVLAVGYGVENDEPYWLIKNSWGPKWGLDGFFKLARNKKNHCGIASGASYPLVHVPL